MPKIDRATLAKIAPDPQSVKALEDLFKESTDSSGAIAVVKKIANDAQITANAANLAATNAQTRADAAFQVGTSAQQTADSAQITADDAKDLASDAADQIDIIESPDGAHVVGIQPQGNVSGNNVRDAIYSLDASDGSGFRNVVLNGTFIVNQRRYASGTATTAANQYTLDRWRVVTSGQSVSFVSTSNGNLATAPAGGIEQVIEGSLIVDSTYVINWLGNASGSVNGTSVTKGSLLSLSPGANCTVKFSGGSVGSVQIEKGRTAHQFEPRPYSVELRLCQRYTYGWNSIGTVGVCGGSSGGAYPIAFPTTMRITPNYSSIATTTFIDGVDRISISVASISSVEVAGALMTFTSSATVAGRAAVLDGGGYAIFSAEF